MKTFLSLNLVALYFLAPHSLWSEEQKSDAASSSDRVLARSALVGHGETVTLQWKVDKSSRHFCVLYRESSEPSQGEDLKTELTFGHEQAAFTLINERNEGFYRVEAVDNSNADAVGPKIRLPEQILSADFDGDGSRDLAVRTHGTTASPEFGTLSVTAFLE